MELFHELKNAACITLQKIIDEVVNGADYSYQEVLDRLTDSFATRELDNHLEESMIKAIFDCTDKNHLILHIASPIPACPSQVEKEWLKSILLDENYIPFLQPALRDKLLTNLVQTNSLIPANVWETHTYIGDDLTNPQFQQKLRIILTALQTKKQVSYVNQDFAGNIHTHTQSPHRLEYSLKENKYYLIVWNEEQNRAIKINIDNLVKITLTNIAIPKAQYEKIRTFFIERLNTNEPLVIKIRQKNNAVERAFALFACYDKKSYVEGEYYKMEIYFRNFDEAQIIHALLSLGSAVTVDSPTRIRDKIIQIVQETYQHYQDNLSF